MCGLEQSRGRGELSKAGQQKAWWRRAKGREELNQGLKDGTKLLWRGFDGPGRRGVPSGLRALLLRLARSRRRIMYLRIVRNPPRMCWRLRSCCLTCAYRGGSPSRRRPGLVHLSELLTARSCRSRSLVALPQRPTPVRISNFQLSNRRAATGLQHSGTQGTSRRRAGSKRVG